jgi:hypothetical protein
MEYRVRGGRRRVTVVTDGNRVQPMPAGTS